MRIDRIAAALSAATSHISAPPAAARGTVLRASSSLQDLQSQSPSDAEFGLLLPKADSLRENGCASFSKDRDRPSQVVPFFAWRKKALRMGLLALCVVSVLVMVIYLAFSYFRTVSNYYVVLDCGSTGTRAYVYRWSVNRRRGQGGLPITLQSLPEGNKWKFMGRSGRAYKRMETEPGFDKLVRNETGLWVAMDPLLRWAEKQIPKNSWKSTPVLLYATAGMRRLPKKDSDWILEKASSILLRSKFMYRREWVKIISGMEEAYYGWIALNYHMGVLGGLSQKGTFGSLDLGGSSLQVTFENEDAMRDETGLRLSIGSVHHHLNAYSLSGYGLNDAFDKSVAHLLKRSPSSSFLTDGSFVLRHPCLQSGYKDRYVCSRCSQLHRDGSPMVGGRNGRKHEVGVPVKLLGDPKWEECSSLAKAVVNLSEWSARNPGIDCDLRPCALNDKLPWPHGKFYAMSGFFVVFKFFNLSSDSTIEDMLHKGNDFCSKTWEAAKNSVVSQPFIEQYCFRAPYVASLLRDGLHISDSHVIIGSGSITWTLGVALLEAGQASSSRMDLSAYNFLQPRKRTYIILLLSVVIILLCLYSLSRKWKIRFLRRLPLPFFRSHGILPYFGRWSPINSGDDRLKSPSSPKVVGPQCLFGSKYAMRGNTVHPAESSLHVSTSGLSRSYSGGLGQITSENAVGTFWPPHRNQMQISSRRSLSREDLSSPQSEGHMVKS